VEVVLRTEVFMKGIKTFKELLVWKKAHELSVDVSHLVRNFPEDEKYELCSQMRRSARSIPAEISEGFGRFHFNDKLTFYERSRASLFELSNHFEEAFGNRYISNNVFQSFKKRMDEINFLLNRMIRKIKRSRNEHKATKSLKLKTKTRC